MKLTAKGAWEGMKTIVAVVLFAVGVTWALSVWYSQLNGTLQQIQRTQHDLYMHTCRHDQTQHEFNRGIKDSLQWMQKQVNSGQDGRAPELPDIPDDLEYCPSPDPVIQNQNQNNAGHSLVVAPNIDADAATPHIYDPSNGR